QLNALFLVNDSPLPCLSLSLSLSIDFFTSEFLGVGAMASNLLKALIRSQILPASRRNFSVATTQLGIPTDDLVGNHTAKWMQDRSKKSPMELINEVPPIKVDGRIAACEGDTNPALGHPIEFICLDQDEPAICKYCGLRYVQDHHH
ncbi:hypothetical protein CARUB_v10014855mg, partial [Capsella rubella]